MSFAETRQIMADLQEIMQLLQKADIKSDKLSEKTPKLEKTGATLQQTERLALRYLSIARRMGLPDEIEAATQIIATLIVMFRMLHISASLISGGGIGALIGIAGIITVTMTANDMVGYDNMRGI